MLNRDEPRRPLPERLQELADFLERNGVDLDALPDLGRLEKLQGGTWETAIKIIDPETGEHRVEKHRQERAGWVVTPTWDTGPQWPLIEPGPPFIIKHREQNPSDTGSDMRSLVALPDIQAPFHDEAALDVALEITAAVRPDVVALLGDNLDAPSMSRFRQRPEFRDAMQAGIDRMTLFCAELRQIVGDDAEIWWLAGNHDERLQNWTLDNDAAAFGITRGQLPNDWGSERPVLSVENLCRLGESGVTYCGGYPAATLWFQPNVRVIHGTYTGKNAANKYLAEGVTTIFGHVHHRVWLEKVLADGRLIHAISPGGLMAVDGSVPGTMTGYDWDGPIRQPVDWQQGLLIGYGDGDGFWPEMVPIRDGRAVWRGQVIAT